MIQVAAKLPPPCRERLGTKSRICQHADMRYAIFSTIILGTHYSVGTVVYEIISEPRKLGGSRIYFYWGVRFGIWT